MASSAEGRMASTAQNRTAGRLLRDMRKASGLRQGDFASALTDQLGTFVQQSTISSWESGIRAVPAAAILAAQAVSNSSLDYLLNDTQTLTSEAVYRDATRQLADTVQQLAQMVAEGQTKSSEADALRVLVKARRVRKLLDGTDTSGD